ncbi:8-amino-7-oxononanoate synthase [Flavobacterium sp.]|uniref:8-amino-7-oxononanoate synthase n=1 Tax=Flavobacterium sp. TaxID=239 RepID=UPI00286A5091|nr:8-amino-7-oxononanoate synthase [Flavobacterium sp.]
MNPYTYQLYSSVSQLPADWNALAVDNVFLSTSYLEVLEKSAPLNMTCHFIGLFENDALIGVALSQFLNVNELESFGDRDRCLKTSLRNFVFRNFGSHVLFIGNNMLTGQNACAFSKGCNIPKALKTLQSAAEALQADFKSKGKKVHILTFKDFDAHEISLFDPDDFKAFYQFSTQPNMVFSVNSNWKTEQDYIDALTKKYRDQYKRARKKADGIEKRKMHLEDILAHETTIYDLYFHVAKNAPFNTFFLAKNHFSTFKSIFQDKFLFYGYFINEKMIGFNTMIKNGKSLDTYFLGYDESMQREKMLYLNMLYDMIAYGIKKEFEEIIFSRTALEIKSSVGAKPIKTYGFMKHENNILNRYMSKIFPYLEPEMIWQQRNPFQ